MGRSAGTGSPIFFVCPAARRTRNWRDPYPPGHDRIVRTGRTKPNNRSGPKGLRSLHTLHEYRCECGHVGWTNHIDIERYPKEP